MDLGTIIGVLVAVIMLIGSIIMAGGAIPGFIDLSALVIIFGGTVCGILIAFPMRSLLNLPALLARVFFGTPRNLMPTIDQIVQLAETARRDGLLALEGQLHELDDPFLINGIRMAVDGLTPETVESIMRNEMKSMHARHNTGRKMIAQMGRTAPMFGLVATLMGLIMMLANMNPQTIAGHMSLALLGTFYGAVLANLFFLPCSEKLGFFHSRELEIMELTIIGVTAIQSGENPMVIRRRLATFLPPNQRWGLSHEE